MFILFGWGKVTKKVIGPMFEKACGFCNHTELWELCKNRTWFTLFFIPLIPYKTTHSITCPNCGSYITLTAEQFDAMKAELAANGSVDTAVVSDNLKYAGKNAVQINYLKQMEEMNNNK